MSAINVSFNLPDEIARGLEAGRYARDGGVIVDGATRHVVKWLDEVELPRVGEVSEGASLLHVGASLLTRASAAIQMAAIEEKLQRIADGVHELLNLSHDERRSISSACVEDLVRRLRRGEPLSHDLLRDIRGAELRVGSVLKRAATDGVEKARDEGSILGVFVKALLVVPGVMSEFAAYRRGGQMGAFIAATFDEYCGISFARGVALTQLAPDELGAWERDFCAMLPNIAWGLIEAAIGDDILSLEPTPGVSLSKLKIEYEGHCLTPELLVSASLRLPECSRACPDEFMPAIRSGLYLVADLMEMARSGHLVNEVQRASQRLLFVGDNAKSQRWYTLRETGEVQRRLLSALLTIDTPLVSRVYDNLFGEPNVVTIATSDVRALSSVLEASGFGSLASRFEAVE
jgi:hypothetical protein